MQTFKSTVKLTPEIYSAFQEKVLLFPDRFPGKTHYISYSITVAISILILLLCPEDGWRALAVGALFTVCLLLMLAVLLRVSNLAQPKLNKLIYGTPAPTIELWLEDGRIVEHRIDTGITKRYSLTYTKVYLTDHYIFILGDFNHLFVFAKSDFTEDELSDLLLTLRKLCDRIIQRSTGD